MCTHDFSGSLEASPAQLQRLRTTVMVVALLNFTYFFVEGAVALRIGSASLMADSIDFLEDTAVNTLIFLALFWSLKARSWAGKAMAVIICAPALVAAWQIASQFSNPQAPDPLRLVLTAGGAVVVNGICAWVLAKFHDDGGSLTKAAFLAARNDVLVNVAIIGMGLLTAWTGSGWPDLILAAIILVLNLSAAKEVWEVSEEERLTAKALEGDID